MDSEAQEVFDQDDFFPRLRQHLQGLSSRLVHRAASLHGGGGEKEGEKPRGAGGERQQRGASGQKGNQPGKEQL